jgi:hypothetical protein
MGSRFEPARTSSLVESVRGYGALAGQSIVLGSLVLLDANGLLNLCGADPASILGVALNPQGAAPGFAASNSPTLINSLPQVDKVSVALAARDVEFVGQMTNGSATPVTPTVAMIGDPFGVVNQSGIWTVDQAEAVNTRVRITDVDIDNKLVFFKFLEANIQLP